MADEAAEKRQQLFIPPELSHPRAVDEMLSVEEFFAVSVFRDIRDPRRRKELERRLGQRSAVLRYYARGETIISQGEAGETAFYVLTYEDVVALRRHQVETVDAIAAIEDAPPPAEGEEAAPRKGRAAATMEHRLASFVRRERDRVREPWVAEIERTEDEIAELPDEDTRPAAATAWLLAQAPGRRRKSSMGELRRRARAMANKLFGAFHKRVENDERELPKSIPIDAVTDIDPETMRGNIGHGEVFGEMSCLHRSPRSATIVADRPCYMVEMLRNVLDQLHLDDSFRERMRAKYVERVLNKQLRRLSIFEKLTDAQFEWLLDPAYERIDWLDHETGDVICEEGEESDAIYIVHKGLVKVLDNVRARLLPEDFDEENLWAKSLKRAWTLIAEADEAGEQRRVAREKREEAAKKAAEKAAEVAAKKAAEAEAKGEAPPAKKGPPLPKGKPVPKPGAAAKTKEPPLSWPERLRDSVAGCLRQAFAEYEVEAGRDDEVARAALVAGFNAFVESGDMTTTRGKPKEGRDDPRWTTSKEIVEEVGDAELERLFANASNDTESWSQLELWLFRRRLLELAMPRVVPERTAKGERRRVLAYVGPGQLLGEMGVMESVLGNGHGRRTATCVAYDHPDRPTDDIKFPDASKGAVTRVELISVRREVFEQLVEASPEFREEVEEIIRRRKWAKKPKRSSAADDAKLLPTIESQRFDDLGLVQGQQLMLIDLDRCTRCNACVEACVKSHDDGHTRLFLDGPQFQSYLVPLTCRSCLDPVCMIGCPVGSINRGDLGEIVIEPWCIGCNLCANQCPYGSIQMEPLRDVDTQRIEKHAKSVFKELGESTLDFEFKIPKRQAVVCDLCSSSSSPGPACVRACPHDAAFRVDALTTFQPSEHAAPPG